MKKDIPTLKQSTIEKHIVEKANFPIKYRAMVSNDEKLVHTVLKEVARIVDEYNHAGCVIDGDVVLSFETEILKKMK